ncbi:MAG: Fe-S-cluster-containing hydrogenase [Leptospiraceae bacterium]|nr:MAG: Fe-S-cluster-containing hydrogenase [Leptospiraceae bacterium]
MDRKDFFTKGIKELAKELYKTPVGNFIDLRLQTIVNALEPFANYSEDVDTNQKSNSNDKNNKTIHKVIFVRPPGSNPNPEKFLRLCNTCGDCIIACPYNAIFKIEGIEGPVMNPNLKACYLCEDYPCIEACETNALMPLEENTFPYFGYAEINIEKCQNYELLNSRKKKLNCSLCYDECPIEDAISIYNKVPEILENCIGCGICKHQCPENAIEIKLE